ncbi:hypothetical protein [Jiella sp. M17.18]|uniref:hypothetical protein n=1 Tax=Jiella sp. M17.18 TaxID=3234247 RepID=UPI0034DED47B
MKIVSTLCAAVLAVATLGGCTSTSTASSQTYGSPASELAATGKTVGFVPYSGKSAVGILAKPYFISFRGRNALSYGHSFVVFGELDSRGNVPYNTKGVLIPSMTEVAGLHPASTSNVPYALGHLIAVPSETGPSDGDTELGYLEAEMTIPLSPEEYKRVVAYIRKLQRTSPLWQAEIYNCSSFTNDIASFMGLHTANHLLFPPNYIMALRRANPGVKTLPGVTYKG